MSRGLPATLRTALLRAEAQRLWREPRLRWVAMLAPVLLLIVFFASMNSAARMADERTRFAASERARWVAQGQKDPHSAAHFGVWAVKPSSPLQVLAPGIEPFVGLSVWLEAHKRNEMIFRPNQDADPIMRSAASVAQVLEVLGPMFAILLGFAGFAQDRQRGTLRMAFGNGATPGRLLLSRFAVMVGLLVCMALAPVVAMGSYALQALPDAGWGGAGRLALWSLLNFLYLLVFLLIALAVSLKAPSARAALTIMLVLWLVLCVVLPRAAGNAAQVLAPVPSYQEVRSHLETESPAYEGADKWEARRQALIKAGATNVRAAQLDQSERESHAVFDRVLGRFYDSVEQQDRTFGWLGAFTPTVALQASGAAVAGTDFYQHRHFIEAAETYRRAMVNRLNGDLMRHTEHEDASKSTGQQFWEAVPAFAYRAPPLGSVLANAAAPLLLLSGWCAVAGLAAWRAAKGVRP
ncbi:ABC transporter permease subunit [Massilia sp. CCM 8733]|uniref:ABC transporter permease subunit n=1 Tax=Massilia mucilaginosa TaxID=2609282 RepID=A0ABX0NZ84_9BURK|nr:ABC transporter permease subunit [Massilia mucilaginosa]